MNYYILIRKYLIQFSIIVLVVSCVNPVPRKPVTRKTSDVVDASVSYNKNLNAREEQAFKRIMENDSTAHYQSSSHGFWYKINNKSTLDYLPKFGDKLNFEFEVFDLNSNQIYEKEEIGKQTYIVDQEEIQEGLRNGLKLMNEGDSFTFLFPSHKMFGYVGDEKKVGINQPLIYKVQLNKIDKKNESN